MRHENEVLLKELRCLPCIWCDSPPPNDVHHIFPRQMGAGNRIDARYLLASLCRNCHMQAENGNIEKNMICGKVLEREAWHLRRIPKEAHERFAHIMDDLNQLMRDYP
jgi:hypothetical protein